MSKDDNIKVQLQLLQAKELQRLSEFGDKFKETVDLLVSHTIQGSGNRGGSSYSASPPSGAIGNTPERRFGGRSMSSYAQIGPSTQEAIANRREELGARGSGYHDNSQVRIEKNRQVMIQDMLGGPSRKNRVLAEWSQAPDVLTEMEQASIRLSSGGPIRPSDVLRNASYHTGKWAFQKYKEDNSTGHGLARFSGYTGIAARGVDAIPQATAVKDQALGTLDRVFNNSIVQRSKGYGYSGHNMFGDGWRESGSNWWTKKKASAFGLNPTMKGGDELMATMEQMGVSTRNPRNAQYFTDVLRKSNDIGIDSSELAQYTESTRRHAPQKLDQVMKDISGLGDAAKKAGYNVDVLFKNLVQASNSLGQQYGRSATAFTKPLLDMTKKTGLLPETGARMLSDPNQVYLAAAQLGKRPGELMNNPELMVQAKAAQAQAFSGVDISKFGSMSKSERKKAENQWMEFMLLPGSEQFTGGMTLEEMMTVQAQGAMTDGSQEKASSILKKAYGAKSKGGEKVTQKELERAAKAAYNGDKDAIELWKQSTEGMKTSDKAKALSKTVGYERQSSVEIRLSKQAAKLLKIYDPKTGQISGRNAASVAFDYIYPFND